MSFFPNAARPLAVGAALAAGLALTNCGDGHETDCLKSNGPTIVQRRPVSRQVRQVLVYDNVDLTIVPDTATYAEVRAGEHVIDDIEFSTTAGPRQLIIRNTSTCNWTRSYDTPREVRLHVPRLRQLEQHGYGLVSTAGQWAIDTLYARIQSTGDMNLNLQATYLYIDIYDAGDMTLSGFAHDFHPNLGANGFLFASALRADYCYFLTYPSWVGDAHVRPLINLGGTLQGSGTFYYTGQPPYMDVKGPNTRLVRE